MNATCTLRPGVLIGVRAALALAIVAAWEYAVALNPSKEVFIGRPTEVISEIGLLLVDPNTLNAALITFGEAVIGLTVGGLVGVALATFAFKSPFLRAALDPIVLILYAMPRLALIPILLVWFGFGMSSKIALVSIHAFVLLLSATYAGLAAVPGHLEASLRLMGARRSEIWTAVLIPSATPFLLAAARAALGLGLATAVVAEMIGAENGLGFLLAKRFGNFETSAGLALLIIVSAGAVVLDTLLSRWERRVLKWR